MTCNHVANVFAGALPDWLTVVLYTFGGVTFPVMCFLLVVGYQHTSDIRKYALRLAGFAVVAQVPYSLLWGAVPNVLWTLLVALGILWAYDNLKRQWQFWVLLVVAYFATAQFDWGGVGVVMAWLFYLLRDRREGVLLVMLIPMAATLMPVVSSFASLESAGHDSLQALVALFDFDAATVAPSIACAAGGNEILQAGLYVSLFGIVGYSVVGFGYAAALIYFYNGQRGRPLKWFFYCYYPAHLAVIWLASVV